MQTWPYFIHLQVKRNKTGLRHVSRTAREVMVMKGARFELEHVKYKPRIILTIRPKTSRRRR